MSAVCIIPHSFPLPFGFGRLPTLQSTEAGTSGANGRCAAASARGSGVGSATRRRPDTEARRATGAARPPRTAQMDCVPRVRPFTLPGTVTISTAIIIPSSGACWSRRCESELNVTPCDTEARCTIISALFLLRSARTHFHMTLTSGSRNLCHQHI